ncbi:MAG: hypothetical protein U0K83_05235, partial [Bacteroidales bacterium]|nr:hypothetical protein [Bacteroidales bacterium]
YKDTQFVEQKSLQKKPVCELISSNFSKIKPCFLKLKLCFSKIKQRNKNLKQRFKLLKRHLRKFILEFDVL